jgi:hypothetical protein
VREREREREALMTKRTGIDVLKALYIFRASE